MFNLSIADFFKATLLLAVFCGLAINNAQAFSFYRNLGMGSIGQDVKELQKFLNANGYVLANSGAGAPGRETTYFGAITRAALIRFQKANGISPAVGFFGPITRAAINKKVSDLVLNSQPAAESSGGLQPVDQSNDQPLVVDKSVRYAISGMITGISGTIVVQNNGKDDWTINPTDNSIFTFPTAMLNGQTYLVTVKTKPINQSRPTLLLTLTLSRLRPKPAALLVRWAILLKITAPARFIPLHLTNFLLFWTSLSIRSQPERWPVMNSLILRPTIPLAPPLTAARSNRLLLI